MWSHQCLSWALWCLSWALWCLSWALWCLSWSLWCLMSTLMLDHEHSDVFHEHSDVYHEHSDGFGVFIFLLFLYTIFQAFKTWKIICKIQCKPTKNLMKILKISKTNCPPHPLLHNAIMQNELLVEQLKKVICTVNSNSWIHFVKNSLTLVWRFLRYLSKFSVADHI